MALPKHAASPIMGSLVNNKSLINIPPYSHEVSTDRTLMWVGTFFDKKYSNYGKEVPMYVLLKKT